MTMIDLFTLDEPINYTTDKQRIIAEARERDGYTINPCRYNGKTGLILAIKGKHRMVIDDNGYNCFVNTELNRGI